MQSPEVPDVLPVEDSATELTTSVLWPFSQCLPYSSFPFPFILAYLLLELVINLVTIQENQAKWYHITQLDGLSTQLLQVC